MQRIKWGAKDRGNVAWRNPTKGQRTAGETEDEMEGYCEKRYEGSKFKRR
jgi:hypothetical protein